MGGVDDGEGNGEMEFEDVRVGKSLLESRRLLELVCMGLSFWMRGIKMVLWENDGWLVVVRGSLVFEVGVTLERVIGS